MTLFDKLALPFSFIAAVGEQFTETRCFKGPIMHLQTCRAKQYSAAIQRTTANNCTCHNDVMTSMRSHWSLFGSDVSLYSSHSNAFCFLALQLRGPALWEPVAGSWWYSQASSPLFSFPSPFGFRWRWATAIMWLTEDTVTLAAVVFISQTSPLIILPTPSTDCARVRANGHFQTGSPHRQEGQGTRYALPDSNGPMLYLPSTVFPLKFLLHFFCWRHFLERVSKHADMSFSSWWRQRELWYLTIPTCPGVGSSLWGLHMAAWFSSPSKHVEAPTKHHF